MSELTDLQAAALEVLLDLGTTATLQVVSATYDNAGTVTETVATETVYCSDLQGESSQFFADGTSRRSFGSVYVAASGMTNTPAPGQRLVYQTRRFEITGVEPYRVQGGVAAYRLDVSELGAV